MKNLFLFLFLALGLTISSCSKDDNTTPQNPTPLYIQTQISGFIGDENGFAFEGVEVKWGNKVVFSDINGYFAFPEGKADFYGTPVKIKANGYFDLTKNIRPIGNGVTWMEAQLTPQIFSGSFQASAGGIVTMTGGKLSLPTQGVILKGGGAYTGAVNVYSKVLDPSITSTSKAMPGNLSAIRENGSQVSLGSFGTIAVELKSPSGQLLQVKDGAKAEITMNIPSTMLGSAPANIPLFYLDPDKGKWIEEGTADKVGSTYVGSVKHFSFWTAALPFENVNLNSKVVDGTGAPVNGVSIFTTLSNGLVAGADGYTNNTGEFASQVPAKEVLTIKIVDKCGDVIYNKQVGPFSADVELPNIVVDLTGKAIKLTGTLVDCDADPNTSGYIKIEMDGSVTLLNVASDGSINSVVPTCGASVLVATGYGTGDQEESNIDEYSIVGLNGLDLGEISPCWIIIPQISFSLDNVSAQFNNLDVHGEFLDSTLTISGSDPILPDSSQIQILLKATSPGTYIPSSIWVSTVEQGTGAFKVGYCSGCQNMQVIITSYGNVGERIEGTFSGTLDGAGEQLNGAFNVIREQ